MSISTGFLTLALLVSNFLGSSDVYAMDVVSYKNQALTSIRLELWYQGLSPVAAQASSEEETANEATEIPEELAVALKMQLAH